MISADREKVELYISCRKLKNLDVFSKSDPQVRCYLKDKGSWKLFARTEVINDNLNPNFKTTFIVDFIFEVQQHIMFEVVDIDSSNSFEPLGSVETTIGAIMGAKKQTSILDLHLKGNKTAGKLIIRGERSGEPRNSVYWQWSATKLMNTDGFFGKSDPFLRFFKLRAGGDQLQVHETEVVMDNLNPIWKPFEIVDSKLCNEHNEKFKIECWDWEKSGKFQFIGACETSLAEIKSGRTELDLQNPKKKSKTGTLRVGAFALNEKHSFIDYLRGGTQLNAIVAIDFTGSNGHPSSASSLHSLKPNGQMNEYQKAINAVCQIVLNYDFDQMVPVYGFGGKPHYPSMSSNVTSHCFPCSGNLQQQEVLGLQGILDVYSYGLQHVELSGPTYFAPLIREASMVCQSNKQSENDIYSILLIITDGEIHDMDETRDAIVKAAFLPLSIIIVGVGNADFSKMEVLDGDQGLCNSQGQRAARDLVQFVPFREFNGDMYLLAQHLLYEVPEQLTQYMKTAGKKPRPPQIVDVNQLGFSVMPGSNPNPNPNPNPNFNPGPAPQMEQPRQDIPQSNPYSAPSNNNAYGKSQTQVSPDLLQYVGMNSSQNVNIQFQANQNVNIQFQGNQNQNQNQNYQPGYGYQGQ